jgi:hypothetical protein
MRINPDRGNWRLILGIFRSYIPVRNKLRKWLRRYEREGEIGLRARVIAHIAR